MNKNNTEDILKRILLNMNYDSKKTLSENKNNILVEQSIDDYKGFDRTRIDAEAKNLGISTDEYIRLGTTENDYKYYSDSYITYKTVVPGKTITVPDNRFIQREKQRLIIQPLSWHNKDEPYNEKTANSIFGKACENVKYFIDDQGNECTELDSSGNYKIKNDYTLERRGNMLSGYPTIIKVAKETPVVISKDSTFIQFSVSYNTDFDGSIMDMQHPEPAKFNCGDSIWLGKQQYGHTEGDTQLGKSYLIQTLKDKFCKNGKIINFTNQIRERGTFDSKCKRLDKDVCLRWSWTTLNTYGGVDKGLKRFKLYDNYEKAKLGDGKTYSACIGIPKDGTIDNRNFPWLYEYTNLYDESKMVKFEGATLRACPSGTETELPTIPKVVYGKDNEVTTDLSKNSEELENLKNSGLSDVDKFTKARDLTVIGGGMRIKGK